MEKYFLPLLFVSFLFIFSSCRNEKDEPYIRFRDKDGQEYSERVMVPLNTDLKLFVYIGYEEKGENNLIHYERSIDGSPFSDITFTGTLDILSVGRFNNLLTEKASIDISFNEERVSEGSVVQIRVRDSGTLSKTITFEVLTETES